LSTRRHVAVIVVSARPLIKHPKKSNSRKR